MPHPILVVEFARPSNIVQERDRPSQFRIIGNGPPGTFVAFPDGLRVSLPTDQIVQIDDAGGFARVGFGGMAFVGLREGQLEFARVLELMPEDRLSPERSQTMRLEPGWITRIQVNSETVWERSMADRVWEK